MKKLICPTFEIICDNENNLIDCLASEFRKNKANRVKLNNNTLQITKNQNLNRLNLLFSTKFKCEITFENRIIKVKINLLFQLIFLVLTLFLPFFLHAFLTGTYVNSIMIYLSIIIFWFTFKRFILINKIKNVILMKLHEIDLKKKNFIKKQVNNRE